MDFSWVDTDDTNAIQNAIVDAKGDLISATANDTPARLAVGANGETLVADSSTSTGLRYTALFGANKNKIINGDFGIWQRGTSFTTNSAYTADRFQMVTTAGQGTVSQQTFTPGAAPVAGYEAQYFLRYNATASNLDPRIIQRIEDVRTFAGQTITVSFWAKSATSNALSAIDIRQDFGSGGSTVVILTSPSFTLTSSWVRYSTTINIPSISGKTIGTNNNLRITFDLADSTAFDFDLWGVQVEAGSIATPFQTATGTIQGELAACQRYYFRINAKDNYSIFGLANGGTTTAAYGYITPSVRMRAMNSITSLNVALLDGPGAVTAITAMANQGNYTSDTNYGVAITVASGLTANRPYFIQANNNSGAFVAIDGEL
jgi:hypothetical protein